MKKIVLQIRKTLRTIKKIQKLESLEVDKAYERLKNDKRYDDIKCLVRSGNKVYSQNEEDGIIQEIFNRIGTTNKVFVEFGIGNGLENNTLALLFQGWKGLWIDGSQTAVQSITKSLPETIRGGHLNILESFITCENINDLISSSIHVREIDFLSIDIDGNDYHILKSITVVNPRVIVIEYNAKFPPYVSYCMDYKADHVWSGDDNFGVSLKYLEDNLEQYSLVGCNLTGSNAFFVRNDLLGDKFSAPYTAEKHFQPARYFLTGYSSGHAASFTTLERRVKT